jgi:hypothetical protein
MDTEPFTVRSPMLIGARLMPAVNVTDAGSTIHITPTGREHDGRVVWRYIIEDSHRHVLDDATDLRSGTGDDIDPRKAMATLLGFLGAAAEAYRHTMNGQTSENADLFPPEVTEWAYEHDDELAALALELAEPDTSSNAGPATPAERDAVWRQVWAQTACADCAGAAVDGHPWGPDHCWATHRPHTPPTGTTQPGARR